MESEVLEILRAVPPFRTAPVCAISFPCLAARTVKPPLAGRTAAATWWLMFRRFCKKVLTPPMIVVAALFLFVEEWIWDHLTAFMAFVARAPAIRWLEARIAALPPYGAMAIFILPGLILLPIKIAALWLAAHGHALYAVGVFILAKVLGTAVAARLFTLCRPALLTVHWFQRLYNWFGRVRDRLYHSAAWQAAVRWKNAIKTGWARLTYRWRGGRLKRRWRAIGHWMRRKFTRKPALSSTAPAPSVPPPPPAESTNSPH